ncbi:MAG TPA: hypothetical protein VIJ37_00645 [Steroidobacteraceae bacterium]
MKLHLSMSVWPIALAWGLCAVNARADVLMTDAPAMNVPATNVLAMVEPAADTLATNVPVAPAHSTSAHAAPVSRLEVRIVTGGSELSAGSSLELRIYETGKVRRLPLLHGEGWPPEATHVIPLKLSEPLDPRNVRRFGLYYHAGNPLAPALEIVSADVEMPQANKSPERLLDATLSGVIDRQGELATEERDAAALSCETDADCDDKKMCNGRERCEPHAAGADIRGCVKGTPVTCPVNQVCGEGVGCRGPDSLKVLGAKP